MKNASAKNTVAVLYVTVMALALSVGAFAGTANAQFANEGYFSGAAPDFGSTFYSPDTTTYYSPDTTTYYSPDTTSYYSPDTTTYYSPDTTTYYSPDTTTYYSPDTTTYYSPDSTTYYSPDTTTYYSPDSTTYYSPDTTTYYSPDTSYTYSPQTPYYSSGCNCYASQPNYGTSYGSSATYGTSYGTTASYMPPVAQYAVRNTPAAPYVFAPSPVSKPSYQPTYAAVTTPAPTYNTNTNANTNTNNPTAVATATATNGDNVNTNVASTGAITNTFAPVINVGSGGSTHRPAQYQFPRPVCTIYASGNYNQTTLTWSSQNATTAYISPNVGNVPVNGSRSVYSQGYTTYTLTVTGSGGSATCQTAANYAGVYTVAPTYPVSASPAPYVALSQIPYTGFDYGPVGNAIYWTAILAFAAAAGYLLVYGMPTFAFAGFGRKEENTFADASVQEARLNDEVGQVFKQNLVPATEMVAEETFNLPVATSAQAGLTSDAMILDRSSDTPRIVIARA